MTAQQAAKDKRFGTWHWTFQILPPALILGTLFAAGNGVALVFLAAIFLIPVLFSFISIILKLFAFRSRKYYLLRPVLTVAFFFAVLGIAQWSYDVALNQATAAAEQLQQQCNARGVCPERPEGWSVDGERISRNDLGLWHKYSASYSYSPAYFDIHVYQGPDLGDVITGGVGVAFNVERYVENQ